MEKSKCPHCQKTEFEAVTEPIVGWTASILPTIIRCQSCKTVISVLDAADITASINSLKNQIQELKS